MEKLKQIGISEISVPDISNSISFSQLPEIGDERISKLTIQNIKAINDSANKNKVKLSSLCNLHLKLQPLPQVNSEVLKQFKPVFCESQVSPE